MREIKFRVWAKSSLGQPLNKFIYSDEFHDYNKNDRMYWFFKYLSDQDIVFDEYQLFTRLEDKNGVEIYEGDILSDGDKIGIVIFDEIRSAYMVDNDGHKYYFNECCFDEIVGNIYENPLLLLEKEIDDAIVIAKDKLNKILEDNK